LCLVHIRENAHSWCIFILLCLWGRRLLVWLYMLGKYIFHDLKTTTTILHKYYLQNSYLLLEFNMNYWSRSNNAFLKALTFFQFQILFGARSIRIYLSTYWFKASFWFLDNRITLINPTNIEPGYNGGVKNLEGCSLASTLKDLRERSSRFRVSSVKNSTMSTSFSWIDSF
jgi:hypothetical protein